MKNVLAFVTILFCITSHPVVHAADIGVDARFIRIIKTDATINPADANRFHIGEVEAFLFGVPPAAGLDNANDLALSTKGATASTVSGAAQHGADGNLVSGVRDVGANTWSRQNPLPIIAQVDLGGTFNVGEVRVWQRADNCCQNRLQSFTVELLADDGGNPGPVLFTEVHPGIVPLNSFSSFSTTITTGIVWTGSFDNQRWDEGGNWDLNRVPTTNDVAIFEGTTTPGTAVNLAGTRSVSELIFQAEANGFMFTNGTLEVSSLAHNAVGTNIIDTVLRATNELVVSVAPRGALILQGPTQNDHGAVLLSAGSLYVDGPLSGSGSIAKRGLGTMQFSNPNNDFTGDLSIELGTLELTAEGTLGDTNGIARLLGGATLALNGAFDYLDRNTVQFSDAAILVNTGGDSAINLNLQGRVTTSSDAGTKLTLMGDLNLHAEYLCVSGAGDTVISGDLTGGDPGFAGLDLLPTGDYDVAADGTNLTIHVDHDGLHGWLLIGRGREGWEFDADGQGAISNVYQHLGTTNAFAPAAYSEALINETLYRNGLRADQLEIRLRRAADPEGSTYQEVRWLPIGLAEWAWDFDINPGRPVRSDILVGSPGGPLRNNNANTRESGANDITRIFTWAWTGHNNLKGFSYGTSVTNGASDTVSFLWEFGNENHALPYTEVYIRSRAGASALVKKGAGTLTLSGDNTHASQTIVEAGEVLLDSISALGGTAAPTLVHSGGAIALSGNRDYTFPEAVFLDGSGDGGSLVNREGTNTFGGSVSLAPVIGAVRSGFIGGDVGEGLDLDGDFLYAVNIRGPGDLQVRDAFFTSETNRTGVVVQANSNIINWQNPLWGDTADDDNLERVLQSMRWGNGANLGGIIDIELSGLTPAVPYKLQLLFFEPNNPNRGFDVFFDGLRIYDNFTAGLGVNQGAVLTHEFLASSTNHTLILDGRGAPFADLNPVLHALTLEQNVVFALDQGQANLRSDAGELILNGSLDLDGSELVVSGDGDHRIDVGITGYGSKALRKSGIGTAVLNGNNTYSGGVVVEEGMLVATSNESLGTSLGGTRIDANGILALDGGGGSLHITDDLTVSGTLLNLFGTNEVAAGTTVQAAPFLDGVMHIGSQSGLLVVHPDIDLSVQDLVVDGPGDTVIHGAISNFAGPLTPSLALLDVFATGNLPFTAAGETFEAYVDNDGTDSWLLIGRGREGWEFDADGQGAATNVFKGVGTTNAFAPAAYSEAIINDLLAQSGLTMADIEVRLKRAADIDADTYQEARWRNFPLSDWTWRFNQDPVGLPVEFEILSGPGAPFFDPSSSTRDGTVPPGNSANDAQRVFTWVWAGHGNLPGFSYGGSVLGADNNSPTAFLWEFTTENHAMPYTEVYIRSKHAEPVTIGSALSKSGTGTLTVIGMNSYFAGTTVSGGDLIVDNPSGSGTGSGAVLVASGAGLGGSGSAAGQITLASGATLKPGSDLGTFSADGGLRFDAPGPATTVVIDLAASDVVDQVDVTGPLDLNNATLNLSGVVPQTAGTYVFMLASGGVTGTFDGLPEGAIIDFNGVDLTINYEASQVTLSFDDSMPNPQEGVSIGVVSRGEYLVQFKGAPTTTYNIEFTEQLDPPNWQVIGAETSDGAGAFMLQHTFAGPRGYYRSRLP